MRTLKYRLTTSFVHMRAMTWLCVVIASLWSAQPLWAEEPASKAELIETFTLTNGMRVIVVPNHVVPAVAHMVWYDAGAVDDAPGKSGVAHFLEHLMFRGTEAVPAGEFSRRVARVGGEENAFTSYDYTAYYQKIAKEHLPMVMEMEADRMRNLTFDEAEIVRERDVIIEERHQVIEANVERLFGEQMQATLYKEHPYRRPVIGWEHEMAGLTLADARDYYQRYYAPANAVLVVGGDISAAELQPLAEQYYGVIPAGEKQVRLLRQEPPHYGPRRLRMEHPQVRQLLWRRDYMTPSHLYGESQHAYALIVLSYLLGSDNTGLLYRELVNESQLASSVDAYYGATSRGPGEFSLRVRPLPGVEVAQVEARVDGFLKRLAKDGPKAEDLDRAKRLLKAMTVYSREGIFTLTHFSGMLATLGLDLTYLEQWEANIDAVDAQAIKRALGKVLSRNASVTGILEPELVMPESAEQGGEDAL